MSIQIRYANEDFLRNKSTRELSVFRTAQAKMTLLLIRIILLKYFSHI